jgi:hypothetical protein
MRNGLYPKTERYPQNRTIPKGGISKMDKTGNVYPLPILALEFKPRTYIKCYGDGFLKDFYEDEEIIKIVKAVRRWAKLLYTESNALGIYAMVFAVKKGKSELFKTMVRLTLPTRKLGFKEL